jgi:hypothetical protein
MRLASEQTPDKPVAELIQQTLSIWILGLEPIDAFGLQFGYKKKDSAPFTEP